MLAILYPVFLNIQISEASLTLLQTKPRILLFTFRFEPEEEKTFFLKMLKIKQFCYLMCFWRWVRECMNVPEGTYAQ